jgi:hypothetical protein
MLSGRELQQLGQSRARNLRKTHIVCVFVVTYNPWLQG